MNSQENQTFPAIDEARQLFAQAGLPFPFIPPEMRETFEKIEDWVYGTRLKIPWLYEIRQYATEAITTDIADYLLLGHAGHGIQSWAMHYYLVRGPLALFLQIAWGGAYTDEEKAIGQISTRFAQANDLIQKVEEARQKGSFQPGERLIIVSSEFHDSYWTRINYTRDSDSRPVDNLHYGDDVLRTSLSGL
jgi:hypothetical protein